MHRSKNLEKQGDALPLFLHGYREATAWRKIYLLLHAILKHISVFISLLSSLDFPAPCPYSSSLYLLYQPFVFVHLSFVLILPPSAVFFAVRHLVQRARDDDYDREQSTSNAQQQWEEVGRARVVESCEVCDGQRAPQWHACTRHVETSSWGTLAGTLDKVGC